MTNFIKAGFWGFFAVTVIDLDTMYSMKNK